MDKFLNQIICGDCLDVMKDLPDKSVDLVVTDPPYKIVSRGSVGKGVIQRPKGILSRNDGLLFDHTDIKVTDWIPEIYRLLKEESHCYVFTNVLNLTEMLVESQKAGFQLHNLLVWEKNNCTPSQFYMKNCEYILFLRKGKAKWIHDIGGSKTVHQYNNIIGNKLHPTEKPISLIEMYIKNSSNEGDIILDPFLGSGTTAIAAHNTGRFFIGIEKEPKYCEIARKRVEQAQMQQSLFT